MKNVFDPIPYGQNYELILKLSIIGYVHQIIIGGLSKVEGTEFYNFLENKFI